MINIFKGILIGIGKVIPGVSGSLIAISLGVYEKCIDIISNFFVEIKYNYKFLFNLCIGFLISIVFFSKAIYYLITNYYFYSMCLFIGLIIGTIPNLLKEHKVINKRDYIYILVSFLLVMMISIFGKNEIIIENNICGYLLTIIIGIIDAISMIIPGISGTAIFMILGVYEFVLLLFSNLLFPFIIFFVIGLVIGILITCKFINYCFKHFNNETYLVIIGFMVSSILTLIFNVMNADISFNNLIFGLIITIVGYLISNFFDSKEI